MTRLDNIGGSELGNSQNWQPLMYEPYTEEELIANEQHYFANINESNEQPVVKEVDLEDDDTPLNGTIDGDFAPFKSWDKILGEAKRGDLLEFQRGYYRHWAVFEGCPANGSTSTLSSTIIHVRAHNGQDLECDINSSSNPKKLGATMVDSLTLTLPRLTSYFSSVPWLRLHSLSGPNDSFNSSLSGTGDKSRGPTLSQVLEGTTAVISRDLLSVVAGADPVRINNKRSQARARNLYPFPGPVIVRNAVALINQEVPYQALTLNCEHYVTSWRYGIGWSDQSRDGTLKAYKACHSFYTSYFADGHGVVEAVKRACHTYKSVRNEDFC